MFAIGLHLYFCEKSCTVFEDNRGIFGGGGVSVYSTVMQVHGYIIFKITQLLLLVEEFLHIQAHCTLQAIWFWRSGGILASESTMRFSGNNTFTKLIIMHCTLQEEGSLQILLI